MWRMAGETGSAAFKPQVGEPHFAPVTTCAVSLPCPCHDPYLLVCFRISWPDATVQDLAYAVRDGVLLCHLLHTIDPATVDMRLVNQRPSLAQFLCLKNIRLFLSALTRCFEMSETDLFQPSMLYDYSDFAQVSYLSVISVEPLTTLMRSQNHLFLLVAKIARLAMK